MLGSPAVEESERLDLVLGVADEGVGVSGVGPGFTERAGRMSVREEYFRSGCHAHSCSPDGAHVDAGIGGRVLGGRGQAASYSGGFGQATGEN